MAKQKRVFPDPGPGSLFILLVATVLVGVVLLVREAAPQEVPAAANGTAGPGLIGYAAYLAVYVMVAWGMLNACMRLIEALPEGVMEWLGGRMRQWGGADDVLRAGTGGAGRMGAPAPRAGGGRARGGGAPPADGGGTPTN